MPYVSKQHGTLDIRICIYKSIEIGEEEHIPKNSESDILGKGKRKHLKKLLTLLGTFNISLLISDL